LKKFISFLIKLILSFSLIYILFKQVDLSLVVTKISSLSAFTLFYAVAILYVHLICHFVRWSFILNKININENRYTIFRFLSLSLFFSQMLPSSLGSDGVRIALLKRAGHSITKGSISIIFDRAFHLIGLIIIFLSSYYFYDPRLLSLIPFEIYWISTVLIILLLFIIFKYRHKFESFLKRLKVYVGLKTLKDDFFIFIQDKKITFKIISFSIFGHFLMAYAFTIVMQNLDPSINFFDIILYIPLVSLICQIPISFNGWGLREAAMVGIFSIMNVPTEVSLSTSIIVGLCIVISRLPGILFIFKG